MKLAMLARNAKLYSHLRLKEAAEERGHILDILNTTRCNVNIASHRPTLTYEGKTLSGYDAVIPRIGASNMNYGLAVLRHFEMQGVWPLNESVAIGRSRDKLRSTQILAKYGISLPLTASANDPKAAEGIIKAVKGRRWLSNCLKGRRASASSLPKPCRVQSRRSRPFAGPMSTFWYRNLSQRLAGPTSGLW